jgi:hypothetical protein
VSPQQLRRGIIVGLFGGALIGELLVLVSKVVADASLGEAMVAIGTMALAAATVWLGWQTRETTRVTAEEMTLLKEQTQAIKTTSETARSEAKAQAERFALQTRAHVVWAQAIDLGYSVEIDPKYWTQEMEGADLALRSDLKLRNVAQVPAYIDRVEHSDRIRLAVVTDQLIAGNAEGEITIYIPVGIDQEITIAEDLRIHFRSAYSGEAGSSGAFLYTSGKVSEIHGRMTTDSHEFTGTAFLQLRQ